MMKELIRPALAIIWSIASIFTYVTTGQVPMWMLGITTTCVIWFFRARDIEKKNAKEGQNGEK